MQKLTTLTLVVVSGVFLSGCYSKSCDTTCPSGQRMEVATVKTTPTKSTPAAEPEAEPAAPAQQAPAAPRPEQEAAKL